MHAITEQQFSNDKTKSTQYAAFPEMTVVAKLVRYSPDLQKSTYITVFNKTHYPLPSQVMNS